MAKIGRKFRSQDQAIMPRATAQICTSTVCIDDLAMHPRRILLLTDNDRLPELITIRKMVADVAAPHSAAVALYDLKAAGYLTDPYPHFAGSEWSTHWGRTSCGCWGAAI